MIPVNIFWVLSLSLLVVSFLGLTLIAKIFTKPLDEYNFSFRRIFPFESLKHMKSGVGGIYKTFLFVFTGMCFSPIFTIVNYVNEFQNLLSLCIFITCVFGLAAVCFSFLFFFGAEHTKPHVAIVTITSSLTILGGVLPGFLSLIMYKTFVDHNINSPLTLVFGIISFLLAMAEVAVCFLPKMKSWAKLEKVDDVEITYRRPKVFPLAFLEWATAFILFLEVVCFFLIILKY